ncbi:ATP phosphoribosyltransferase regulatory subunit [bacterium]|nr:ATP phosphoribosyltransferase regulatory subunit [bacterium]
MYGLAQGSEDTKEYSLHFDLTVPFARYILDRENELTFPFKRYQMQPVRRGERAQKGRFREFTQCDIDVIRRKDVAGDYFFYDAEVIFTLSQALTAILTQTHIKDKAIMHISNRKLIFGFLETVVTDEQMPFVTSLIDKYKKIGHEKFKASLQDAKLSSEQIEKICEFITMKCDAEAMGKIASFADTPLFKEGYAQLEQLMTYLETFKKSFGAECEYVIDLQILRGLDYYTGTVFEAFLEQDATLGSICGGGRYGELTGFIDPKRDTYAGV